MKECRLVYKSTATSELLSSSYNLLRLTKHAEDNNQKLNITGLLLISGNQFIQVLEGPVKEVNQLFVNIIKDERHYDVSLIDYEVIVSRYFQNWRMRLVDLSDLFMESRSHFIKSYKHQDEIILIPDELHKAYALLLDTKTYCVNQPWNR